MNYSCIIMKEDGKGAKVQRTKMAHLGVQLIERLNSRLYVAAMDKCLNLLPCADRGAVLLRLQIGLLGKFGGRVGISLHGQVVKNQSIDIAGLRVSQAPQRCKNQDRGARAGRVRIFCVSFSPHGKLGEIPIDKAIIINALGRRQSWRAAWVRHTSWET